MKSIVTINESFLSPELYSYFLTGKGTGARSAAKLNLEPSSTLLIGTALVMSEESVEIKLNSIIMIKSVASPFKTFRVSVLGS